MGVVLLKNKKAPPVGRGLARDLLVEKALVLTPTTQEERAAGEAQEPHRSRLGDGFKNDHYSGTACTGGFVPTAAAAACIGRAGRWKKCRAAPAETTLTAAAESTNTSKKVGPCGTAAAAGIIQPGNHGLRADTTVAPLVVAGTAVTSVATGSAAAAAIRVLTTIFTTRETIATQNARDVVEGVVESIPAGGTCSGSPEACAIVIYSASPAAAKSRDGKHRSAGTIKDRSPSGEPSLVWLRKINEPAGTNRDGEFVAWSHGKAERFNELAAAAATTISATTTATAANHKVVDAEHAGRNSVTATAVEDAGGRVRDHRRDAENCRGEDIFKHQILSG